MNKSIMIVSALFFFGGVLVSGAAETSTAVLPTQTETELRRPQTIPDAANTQLQLVAGGFERPIFVTHAGDGRGRLFVVEQPGVIYIVQEDGTRIVEPFMDISHLAHWLFAFDEDQNYSENGLLGLAFHPSYAENGIFFVSYTDQDGHSALARYRVSAEDANRADLNSGQVILSVEQPHYWHNAGMIAFGPDGYLYLSLGDGGHRSEENGQDLSTLLGSILRLDVDLVGDGYAIPPDNPFVGMEDVRPEIWVYGLRNPWRFSFDRLTGDLWIGDVGDLLYEEVNFQSASSRGGENYGWADWDVLTAGRYPIPLGEITTPIFFYGHEHGIAISAGYVYRGEAIEDLNGVFFFGDFGSGRIWTIYFREDGGLQVNEYLDTDYYISSFGEDEEGELYVVDYFGGSILRFLPRE